MPEREQDARPSPEEQVRALYERAESTAAEAFEGAVASPSFGALLARSAENVAALTRISADVADLVLRNLRIAGRADITRLARQLHRTEDKLERVLQEVEGLRDEVARRAAEQNAASSADNGTSAGAGRPRAVTARRASGSSRARAK